MAGPGRDPRQWAVYAEPGETLFAERLTRAEAEGVAAQHDALIRFFGLPGSTARIAPPLVADLDARRRARAAFRELERRGFVALADRP